MKVPRLDKLNGLILTLVVVVMVFIVFQPAFFIYGDYALRLRAGPGGLSDHEFVRLRLIFWLLYAGMIVVALLSGIAVAWRTRVSPLLAALILVVTVAVLGAYSFAWLEFLNACNVGRSFVLDSSC